MNKNKWISIVFQIDMMRLDQKKYTFLNEFFKNNMSIHRPDDMTPGLFGICSSMHNVGPISTEVLEFDLNDSIYVRLPNIGAI
jgi:hypothetical protein